MMWQLKQIRHLAGTILCVLRLQPIFTNTPPHTPSAGNLHCHPSHIPWCVYLLLFCADLILTRSFNLHVSAVIFTVCCTFAFCTLLL
jgi:hypothetical protein